MSTIHNETEPQKRQFAGAVAGGVIIVLVAAIAAFWGISTRARSLTIVTKETQEVAVPTVAVAVPSHRTVTEEIVLPGTIQPLMEASIYARTSGYLKRWNADIGSHVHAGQVLAEIDTPEVDQQLMQARADLGTSEANARLAQSTAERTRNLFKRELVSRQDLDNADGSLDAKVATVESARANVKRLEQLQAFNRVEAPFNGVVTARNTDIGALVGSNNTKELFHLAATERVRVFVNVPQVYSRAARTGLVADLTLKEYPGRRFKGVLARTSQSIDIASRTLLTEVDVENPTGELLPGSYAEVHLKLPSPASTVELPVSAVIFKNKGVQVATVGADGRVTIVPVTLGRDFGDAVEVLNGLSGNEQVIVNPSDSLSAGSLVRLAKAE
jgi:RND family efflux transporter MFP subunit